MNASSAVDAARKLHALQRKDRRTVVGTNALWPGLAMAIVMEETPVIGGEPFQRGWLVVGEVVLTRPPRPVRWQASRDEKTGEIMAWAMPRVQAGGTP